MSENLSSQNLTVPMGNSSELPVGIGFDPAGNDGIYGPIHMSPQSIGRKGDMEITHFLREDSHLDGFVLRIVTNMPTPAEAEAYFRSTLGSTVETIGLTPQRLLAVNIGSQSMPLFERASEMGVKFRFMTVPIKSLSENPELIEKWATKSHFAWANDRNACFIKFDGVDSDYWGLEPLGLIIENHPKLAKRLNEIARVTSYYHVGPISMEEFATPDGMDDKYFDGMNIVRESFAKTLGFFDSENPDERSRGNIRVLTPHGLIKGDFIVVPDEMINSDLVYHTENLKPAVRTDGWTLTTCMSHHPMHELRHDDQSRANFEFFITHDRVREDLNAMVQAFKTSVSEGGDLADYLAQQSESFDDPIAVDYDNFGTAQRIEDLANELRKVGIAPASFSNITFTRLGAIVRKMESTRIPSVQGVQQKFFKKMAIPSSNAISGAIVTYEACNLMGGMEFRSQDGSMTFFDTRFGIVMPAHRFLATYDLHGGWDLDDTVGLFLIKVYCTDQERLVQLVGSGVLDPQIRVPRNESEAIEVGLMIRRPNGPGEYSIECIDPSTIPWMHYNADRVEVVDLAHAPEDIETVYSRTRIVPFEVQEEIPGLEYTVGVARRAIEAQLSNPGVGSFANFLMAWAATFGAGTLPSEMLGKMEDVVDATQQSADITAFINITHRVRNLWIEFADKVIATSTPVDYALIRTRRIPGRFQGDPPILIGDAIVKAGLVERGNWMRVQNRYHLAIDFCRNLAKDVANETRLHLPLAQRIKTEKFGNEYRVAAADLIKSSAILLKQVDADFRALDASAGDNVVMRRAFQTQRRIATESVMDRLCAAILNMETLDPHTLMLALYKYMVTPRKGWPHGDIDRLLVQPCGECEVSMMELFLEALEYRGILDDVIAASASDS